MKAPFGKHRARMVICGNRVELADPEQANRRSQEPEREEGREVLFGNLAAGYSWLRVFGLETNELTL